MRKILFLLCLAAGSAWAFDSSEWLDKRAMLACEAERLRGVYATCAADASAPAEGVAMTLETHPDGAVKTVLLAAKMKYFKDRGFVWAETLTVRQLSPAGEETARIESAACVLDRETKSGWAEGAAKVVHGGTVMTGDNVYFSSEESYVTVYSNACIVSTDAKDGLGSKSLRGKSGGRAKPKVTDPAARTNGTVRIAGIRSDFDRTEGVAFFEGAVAVAYGTNSTLNADRLYAFFANTNELTRLVAAGSVTMTNDARTGTCELANYRRRANVIDLYATTPGARVRLAEPGHTLEGTHIRFWPETSDVEVENTAIGVDRREKGDAKEKLKEIFR